MLTTKKTKYSSLYAPDGMTSDNMSGYRSTMKGLNDTYGGDILGYQNTDAFKGLDASSQNNYYNDRAYFNNLYGNVSAYDSEWNQNQANLKREQEYANTRKMLMQRYMPETLARMGYANTGAAGDAMLKLNNAYDNYAMTAQNNALNNEANIFSQYNNVLQNVENEKIAEEQGKLKAINDTKADMSKNLATYTDSYLNEWGYKTGLTPQQIQELKDYRDSLSGVGTKGSGYNADISINTQAKAFTPDTAAGYILQNMGQSVSTAGKNRQLKFIQDILEASKNGQIKDGTLIDFNYGLSSSQNQAGTVYIWDEGSGQWIQTNLSRKQAEDMFPDDFYTGDLFGAKGWNWNKLNPFDEEGKSFYTDYDYNAAMEEIPEEDEVASDNTLGKKSKVKAYANTGGETTDPLQDYKNQINENTRDIEIEELIHNGDITAAEARELKKYRDQQKGVTRIDGIQINTKADAITVNDTPESAEEKLGVAVATGGKNRQKSYVQKILQASEEGLIDYGTLVDFNYGLSLNENRAGSVYMWDGEKWLQTTLSRNAASKLAEANGNEFYTGDLFGVKGITRHNAFNRVFGTKGNPFAEEGESFYDRYYPHGGGSNIDLSDKTNLPTRNEVMDMLGREVSRSSKQSDYIGTIIDAALSGYIHDGELVDFNYGASTSKNKAGTVYRWDANAKTFKRTTYSRNSAHSSGEKFYTGNIFGSAAWLQNLAGPVTAKGDSLYKMIKDRREKNK